MVIPKAYEGNEPYIFISYAHKDSDKVIPIIQALQDRGFRVWYDEGLEVGKSWGDMIEEHLYNCACAICFISSNFLNSQNCKDEIDYAKEISKSPLVVYLEDMKPDRKFQFRYGRLHALKYTDFSSLDLFMDKLESTEAIIPCRGSISTTEPETHSKEEYDRTRQEFEEMLLEWVALMGCQILIGEEFDIQNTRRLFTMAKKLGTGAESICSLGDALYAAKDYANAAECYRVASDIGHARATKNLGVCYYQGNGVTMDHKEAAMLIQLAAGQGDREAQHFLGILYEEGHGVLQNLATAILWFQKAGKSEDVQRCQEKLHA